MGTSDDMSWKLTPLTPEYLEDQHGRYVEAITNALDDKRVRNIALSGNYGVGKSSILQEVARQNEKRVVELSLSTLAPIDESSLNGAVPEQATTPTNRIQQEIVKQLLYSTKPHKAPGSRFKRIERFSLYRELAISCLFGLIFTVVFLLTGWTSQLGAELAPLLDLGLRAHFITLFLATGLTFAARCLFHGQIHISQLSTGSASVTLDNRSTSYFDQYLDEIVYFFEISKRDVVIFEDIDRFDDPYIFDTLRALNTLLNTAPQIDKPIRFIYAIKDSMFDQINLEQRNSEEKLDTSVLGDPAQAEVVRANRTKFFDLVIPVVPFITHRSARNLALLLLQDVKADISEDLLDLASQYVPDMRLLKNVRNEFIVFRDRIFSGDGAQLALTESELFAMMLYKSTHLADFETIRIRQSKLDQFYSLFRDLVSTNIKKIESETRALRNRLIRLDEITDHSTRLGDQLISHVERTARAASFSHENGAYSLGGNAKTVEDLKSTDFWTEFVNASRTTKLVWRSQWNGHHHLSFLRTDLADALRSSLEPDHWNQAEREEWEESIKQNSENLKFLRGADMASLILRQPQLHAVHINISRQPREPRRDKLHHPSRRP